MSTAVNTRATWKVVKPNIVARTDKTRRGTKARSWTAQEERYLLDCRDRRLPYRRIATELKKTELACRLHYHQLTVVRARQGEDASTTVAPSPETAASMCDEPSPKSAHGQIATSPETEDRTLSKRHQWQDNSSYDSRSTSLPTPTPSRDGSPQSITSQCSPYYHGHHQRPSPPTPPNAQHPSPRVPHRAGLGLTACPPNHQGTVSYPPTVAARPQYFPPTPKASHDDALDYASHWEQWTSRRFPVTGQTGYETDWSSQRHESGRPPARKTSTASSLDRCSVHSLLNP